jgi:hypothetical protein
VRDGSSILYDLEPMYLSMNVGQFGINGNNDIKLFHVCDKKGIQINDHDYIVTVMRHKI